MTTPGWISSLLLARPVAALRTRTVVAQRASASAQIAQARARSNDGRDDAVERAMANWAEDASRVVDQVRAPAEAGVWERFGGVLEDANRSFRREWSANDLFAENERVVRSRSRWIDEGPAEFHRNREIDRRHDQHVAGNARCNCEEWG